MCDEFKDDGKMSVLMEGMGYFMRMGEIYNEIMFPT
jgi:hypothetical protein